MAVPAHDQRDFEFATQYKLPIKPVIKPKDGELELPLTAGLRRLRRLHQLRQVRRPRLRAGGRCDRRGPRRERARREAGALSPARLGHLAPALLGLPDPDRPLREVRRRAGARRPAAGRAARRLRARRQRQSAQQARRFREHDVPEVRRPRRSAKPTRWTPSSIRRGTTCASRARTRTTRWSTSASITGCRSTSTSAASSTRSCTCSIRASGPRRCATSGSSRSTSRSRTCSRRAWC